MILVDDPVWPAHGRHFAHLISDRSYEELHDFAAKLGLPERAFHRDHYDLPDAWWQRAVDAGAVPVSSRVLVRRLRDSGLRMRPPKPEATQTAEPREPVPCSEGLPSVPSAGKRSV